MQSARVPPSSGDGPLPTPGSFFGVFFSILLPMFLAVVDQTIVATALPSIAGTLGEVELLS